MDCTNAFEDVGHSSSAYEMLKDFYIGDLVESKCGTNGKESNCATKCCDEKKSVPSACSKTSSQ